MVGHELVFDKLFDKSRLYWPNFIQWFILTMFDNIILKLLSLRKSIFHDTIRRPDLINASKFLRPTTPTLLLVRINCIVHLTTQLIYFL